MYKRQLPGLVLPIHEQPLDPHVPDASRVAGEVHALGEWVPAPQAGRQDGKLVLGEVGGFVNADHVIFLPLELVHVVLSGAVPEDDARPVWEGEGLFPVSYTHLDVYKRQLLG